MTLNDELKGDERDARRELGQLAQAQSEIKEQQQEIDRLHETLGLVGRTGQSPLIVPKWTRNYKGRAGKKGITTLQLSDTHFDEVIEPEQIGGFNAYNRRIAELRLRKLGDGWIKLTRDYVAGVEIEGAYMLATGDIFSGDIHEELKMTNEDTLYGSLVHWAEQMSAFISMIATEFGRLHIAAVVGNHGRNSHKPIYKNRAQSNIEWVLWKMLEREFAQDKRVTFAISNALGMVVDIYQTRILIEHGDEFKGGSGIAGSRSPLMLGQHRASVRQMVYGTPIDYMCVGHFHQYQPPAQGLIMGGSLKGYDEFAAGKKFRPERPQQAWWITSPEHGPTISGPVLVQNRKAEGW